MTALQKIRTKIQENQILILSTPSNVFWSTGFTGSAGIAVISKETAFFITDERYLLQSKEEIDSNLFNIQTIEPTEDLKKYTWNQIEKLSKKEILFENEISYSDWQAWSLFSNHIQPMNNLINQLRLTKTTEEINKIKEAARIIDKAFEYIQTLLKPGIQEKEIEIELEFFIKKLGVQFSFNPIIVSGKNSAKPHGKATSKKIEEGDLVTIDAGVKYQGYCSDLTRTFIIGQADQKKLDLYNAVLEAQIAALEFMKPGVLGKEVDAAARDILKKYNLDQYFGHGLGHSLGVNVHDGYRLNPSSDVLLEENQVWTVEPGAYIPDFAGVRIEDDVIITSNGIDITTHSPK